MIQSMTGYGKAEINLANANFTIEVKSLNSKQIDINVKMSSAYRDREIGLRKQLSEKLQRGKIELSIWKEQTESTSQYNINTAVVKDYHRQILKLKEELNLKSNIWGANFYELGLKNTDVIPVLLKLPDALVKGFEKVDENEWDVVQKGIDAAITDLLKFRLDEGRKLEEDMQLRINKIVELLNKISSFEKARIEKVKKKLSEKLAQIETNNIDEVRLEQELIYYLEKQDITEEKVRLEAHLKYFSESMNIEPPNGKKLGFIAQEIGREINTIGSKSSDVNMQKIVVQMKDELEKIKEQLLNIL